MTQDDQLLTYRECAALLRVSLSTVHRLRREGKLQPVQIGRLTRFRRDSLCGISGGKHDPNSCPCCLAAAEQRRRIAQALSGGNE